MAQRAPGKSGQVASQQQPRKGLSGTFYFHGELEHFLLDRQKSQNISLTFNGDQSVKHLIESLGVPHTEVFEVYVNQARVDLSYLVRDGDFVEVHPYSDSALRDTQAEKRGFVLDNHLGRLAVYLRMLGFDAMYHNDYQDEELARIASQEGRVLLTRDVRLLMRNAIQCGYWVRSTIPREQVLEILKRYDLYGAIGPFRRCMRCNGLLQPVSKEDVLERLQPLTRKYFHEFHRCLECDQVYWKGSHYERMQRFIGQIMDNPVIS